MLDSHCSKKYIAKMLYFTRIYEYKTRTIKGSIYFLKRFDNKHHLFLCLILLNSSAI